MLANKFSSDAKKEYLKHLSGDAATGLLEKCDERRLGAPASAPRPLRRSGPCCYHRLLPANYLAKRPCGWRLAAGYYIITDEEEVERNYMDN